MQNENSVIALSPKEQDAFWDDVFLKEEGIVLEFDWDKDSGKLRSLIDGHAYTIVSLASDLMMIELQPGDKVRFIPFEGPEGNDCARLVRITAFN